MPHKMYTVEEVAEYLHIPPEDIRRLVREDAIPHVQQGERCLFQRKDVDAWATKRILDFKGNDLEDYHRITSAKAHDLSRQHAIIPELMRETYISPELHSRTVPSLLRDMTDLADQTGLVVFLDDLRQSVIEREKLGTTALTGGFAMLHPQHHEPYMFEDSFVVLGRTIQPIPFHSPDGRTTDLFFLICCQDDRIHLHVLARLCMMSQQTSLIYELRAAADGEEMFAALCAAEQEIIQKL